MRCVPCIRRAGSLGLSAAHGELRPLLPALPPQGPAAPRGWVGGTLPGQPRPPRLSAPSPITSSALVRGAVVWLCCLSVSLCTWAVLAATSAHTLNGNEKLPDGEKGFRGAAGVGVRSQKVWV